MRVAFAVLLFGHGIAHLVGFAVPWRLVESPDTPYRTTILGSWFDLGANGVKVYGLVWLATAIAFTVVTFAYVLRTPVWYQAAIALVITSIVLCLLSLPETRIGLLVNAVLLLWLTAGKRWLLAPAG